MQFYADKSRESDPYSLPDAEVFEWSDAVSIDAGNEPELFESVFETDAQDFISEGVLSGNTVEVDHAGGWFYWSCFPGCLPDSRPTGPFDSKEEAIAEAQSDFDDE